jgi:hypothetical protein
MDPSSKSGHSSASHEAHGRVTGVGASIRVSRTRLPSPDTLQTHTGPTDASRAWRPQSVSHGPLTGVGAPIHVSWTPHRKSGHSSASCEAHGPVTGVEASIRVSGTPHPSLGTLQPCTRPTDSSQALYPQPMAHGALT